MTILTTRGEQEEKRGQLIDDSFNSTTGSNRNGVCRREILGMAPRGRQVTFYRTLTIFLLSLNDFIVIRTIKIGIGNRLNVQDLKFQIDPISMMMMLMLAAVYRVRGRCYLSTLCPCYPASVTLGSIDNEMPFWTSIARLATRDSLDSFHDLRQRGTGIASHAPSP